MVALEPKGTELNGYEFANVRQLQPVETLKPLIL